MGYAAEERIEDQAPLSSCEDGWYLLRRDVPVLGKRYRAGTLVEHQRGEWFVQDGLRQGREPSRDSMPINPSMVCKTSYAGVSLYEIWKVREGIVFARPVLSDVSPQSVDQMVLNVVLASGQSRVCVRFGRCFLPLELFNW